MIPGRRGAGGFRRRTRLYLFAGGGAFTVLAAAVLLLRARPAPYTPGVEAAQSEEITRTLTRSLPAEAPRIRFTDAAEAAGIHFTHFHGKRSTQIPEDMGSGAAWGDYDNDGDPDLFLVNESGPLTDTPAMTAASPARSALYRNNGDGTFTDVTEAAGLAVRGLGMGAAWGDFDGDGRLDLVVTRFGTILLFRNRGDGTFEDVSDATGIGGIEGFWTGASWADYDRDGDLDLYVCGYVRYRYDADLAARTSLQYKAVVPSTLNPSSYPPERNLLFRNDRGRFREVARQAGVDDLSGRSFSAAWADFDGDGRPDLYVANDVSDNAMFWNKGDGTFQDVSHSAWVADYRGAMGLAIGDWDNDGDLDIFITHWLAQENALYENQKGTMRAGKGDPMHFLDQADMNGLGQIALDFVGWGTGFIDYDNDGRLDLFVVNGSTFQREDDPQHLIPMKNQLFWNAGRSKGFYEVGGASGESFAVENVGRGAAFADYDGDGDQDAVVVVNGGPARLLRNDGGNAGGWVRVILRGRGGATTTFATGAVVRLVGGGLAQIREIGSGPSYLSQSPPGEASFGVGGARTIDLLEVAWPGGSKVTFHDLPARATIRLVEGGQPEILATGQGAASTVPSASPVPGAQAAAIGTKASVLRFWEALGRATALRMKREFGAAATAYQEALAIDPRHEDALYYLGQCLREMGQTDAAGDAFARLVAANPSSARGHLALGALLASPEPGAPLDLAGAESHLRRAHAINGEETGPMLRLGEILIVKDDARGARAWLEAAARTNAKSVEAAFLSGYLRWREGDRAGAREYYLKAARAAHAEAPAHGVKGEGDRKGAAPPLKAPMGKTLFGAFSEPLKAGAAAAASPDAPDLDAIYAPVRDFARTLRQRPRVGTPVAKKS